MTIIVYLFLGVLTATIGALPLGTTNVAVINTTIKENVHSAFKIIYTAAVAELILVLIAINFNMQIEKFVSMNIWLQYTIAILLLIIGGILFLGRQECVKDDNDECVSKKKRRQLSKPLLGFILGLINPMVLIYWIVVIAFLNKKMFYLNINIELSVLAIFLIGVFLGKALTLYGYGKFSHLLKLKMKNTKSKVNRVIGGLLICVSVVQFTKLLYW